MNTYQHILVAIDLSAACKDVMLKAQQLAKLNQAKLSLIHVSEIAPVLDLNYDSVATFDAEMYELIMSNVEKSVHELISETGLELTQLFLEQGDAREEIIRVAKENQVDLIVLGSHGRHGLALLLGSTANAVLHHANCDVLAVRLKNETL